MKKYLAEFLVAVSVLALIIAVNCGEKSTPTSPLPGVPISLGTGKFPNAPKYIWSGGPVTEIYVIRQDTPSVIVWGYRTAGFDSILSPVYHGFLPCSLATSIATKVPPESTLASGINYIVTIIRKSGQKGELLLKR